MIFDQLNKWHKVSIYVTRYC